MRGGLEFRIPESTQITFKAGAGIKALVAAADRDAVVGVPVVISGAGEVDLGTDGDTAFGFIDVYEMDGHCSVQIDKIRDDVPIGAVAPTVGKIVAVDGTGKIKDSSTTAKLRTPVVLAVNETNKVATVFLG
jgi:hypothetical protein